MTKFLPASPLHPVNSHHDEIGVHKHSIAPQAGGPPTFLPANPLQPLNLHRGEVGVRKHSIAPRAQAVDVDQLSTHHRSSSSRRGFGTISHVTQNHRRDQTTRGFRLPLHNGDHTIEQVGREPTFLQSSSSAVAGHRPGLGKFSGEALRVKDLARSPINDEHLHPHIQNVHANNIRAYRHAEIHKRAEAAQNAQNTWFESIGSERRFLEETRRQYLQEVREAQEQRADESRRLQREAYEQKLSAHRARIAAAADQRRRELEEQQRAEAEALRQLEEETERIRRERERDCAVCLDTNDIEDMVEAPCAHWYCRVHLRDAIEAAYNSRTLFQCCQINVPPDLLPGLLSADFRAEYDTLQLELSTPNPVYCSNLSCASFVPPSQARGPDAMDCSRCGVATCRHCRQRSHVGTECVADVQTQQVRALAAAEGWKACPSCANMVEKSSGCLHMTCRCGMEFCYRCGDRYSRCRSTCHER